MGALRPPIPVDEKLPQIARLLDPDAAGTALARIAGRAEPLEVEIRYLRYRPGKNLVVHYGVTVDERDHHVVAVTSAKHDLSGEPSTPEHLERARLVGGRTPATPCTYDDGLRSLVYWLPFDLDLPTLSEPPGAVRERLEHEGVQFEPGDSEPEILQYRPRRRVALRLGRHVIKLYKSGSDFDGGVLGLRASAGVPGVRTARCEAIVPEWKLTVQELLPGLPAARRGDVAHDAGAVLAALHAVRIDGIAPHLPADRLVGVAESVRLVSVVVPTLADRAGALLRMLEAQKPPVDDLVPSHGDFHGGQLLELGDGDYGLIDFDLLCAAPPALDVANYAGHLVAQDGLDVRAAAAVLDALVGGYGRRPAGLTWYLSAAILRSARGPFKRFEVDWPLRIESTVAAAEAALQP